MGPAVPLWTVTVHRFPWNGTACTEQVTARTRPPLPSRGPLLKLLMMLPPTVDPLTVEENPGCAAAGSTVAPA